MVRKQIVYFRTMDFSRQKCQLTFPRHHDSKTLGIISEVELLGINEEALWSASNITSQEEMEYLPNPSGHLEEARDVTVQRSVFPVISFSIDLFTFSCIRLSTPPRSGTIGYGKYPKFHKLLFLQQSIWHIYMVFQCKVLKLPIIMNIIL